MFSNKHQEQNDAEIEKQGEQDKKNKWYLKKVNSEWRDNKNENSRATV